MAQHDAFGCAFGTGGEQNHRRIVRRRLLPVVETRDPASDNAAQFRRDTDSPTQILEIDEPRPLAQFRRRLLKPGCFDELARGQDEAKLRRLAGRLHAGKPGGEIQQRRHAATGLQREESHGGRGRIGQQHADPLFRLRHAGEYAAKREAAGNQPVVAHRLAGDVFDDGAVPAIHVARLAQRAEERVMIVAGLEDQVGHHVVKLEADCLASGTAHKARFDRQALGRLDTQHNLGKPAQPHLAAQPRKAGELRAIDAHRQDLGIRLVGDHAGAFIDLHQGAGDGDAPFREDHALPAGLNGADQRFRRHRVGGIHREGIHQRERRAYPPFVGHMGVDGERRPARQKGGEQDGVEEGDVIGDDHRARPGCAKILHPAQFDAISQPQDTCDRTLHHHAGQQLADIDRHQEVQRAHGSEDCGHAEMERDEGDGDQRTRHHENSVDDVVGGDDAGAMAGLAALLHDRIERHDVEAAGNREQQQVRQHAPGGRQCQELLQAERTLCAAGKGRAGEIEIDGEQGDAERPQRHVTCADLALQQPAAQDGACTDAE